MAIPIILPALAGEFGKEPLVRGMRNGVVPPAPAVLDLAYLTNQTISKRKKVFFRKWVNEADAHEAIASSDTLRTYFLTSPTTNKVRCRMVLAPVEDTEANAPDPRLFWTLVNGGSVAQDTIRYHLRVAAPYTVVPDDWVVVDQDWTVSGNTAYSATLTQVDKLRVLGCTIWEPWQFVLDASSDLSISPKGYVPNLGIYDASVNDCVSTVTTLWKQQGTSFFSWSRPSTTAFTTTSATYVNIIDATTTAWATTSEGFYTDPQYHGAAETVTATNRETVPITFWAYIATSDAAQTVTAALVDQNNGTGAPIATVTRTGAATGAFVTTTANWSAPSNAVMKLDVYLKITGGATGSIWACGAYQSST